jgi:hypothetical protein
MSTPTPEAPTAPTGEPAAPAAPAADASATTETPGQAPATNDVASLPDWAQKQIADLRAEAGKARTTAKQRAADEARAELAQQIGRALGLVQDAEPIDPAALTEQLTASQADALGARIELSVYRTAQRLGANADALLDSRAFVDSIDSLDVDPTDATAFAAAVEERVQAALKANPSLKAGPSGPPQGAADFTGAGDGSVRQLTEDDLKTMTPEQIVAAQEAGQLRNLLGG